MDPHNAVPHETATILIVVNEAAKATRLMPPLEIDGYHFQTVLSLSLPLPRLDDEPDLGIIWFPHASPDALGELESIIRAMRELGRPEPLPILLIVDQDGARWVEPSFRLGIADILMRPIHPLILRQRVRLLLKARQTERLIGQLTHRVEKQERQRMIQALDSALQMFQADPSGSPSTRTTSAQPSAPFSIQRDLVFDAEEHCLIFNGKSPTLARRIVLTADQSAILLYMLCHPYRALSNREIARSALGYEHLDEMQSRSIVRPHILRLRRKLEQDSGESSVLRTVRGSGYVFSPD